MFECIPLAKYRDGNVDCNDGSDEKGTVICSICSLVLVSFFLLIHTIYTSSSLGKGDGHQENVTDKLKT